MERINEAEILFYHKAMLATVPSEYLKRNHLQYEYVSCISLAFSLFIAGMYEASSRFIIRARQSCANVGKEKFSPEFLEKSELFLDLLTKHLLEEDKISIRLHEELKASSNIA